MDEQEENMAVNQNPKESAVCEQCKSNPSKYKCPGCSLRTCSLACVKAHKQRSGCTGKRQQTQFVPLSQFDDNVLFSDYNLLEDVKRVAESAQRWRVKLCGTYFKPPFYLRSLRCAAASRRTKLLFLPRGMSKREKNQSHYSQRKKFISWTVEWHFHSTDVVLLDHGLLYRVNEYTSLFSVIQNHLKPGPLNHRLRQFCEEKLDSLKFFIRKYPKGPRSPFHELNIMAPLSQQLADAVILEYPVIHVLLPSQTHDFGVLQGANPPLDKPEQKVSVANHQPSSEGILFVEEEIEELGSSIDPQVFDLRKCVKLDSIFQIPDRDEGTERESDHSLESDRHFLAGGAPDKKSMVFDNTWIYASKDIKTHSSSKLTEPRVFQDMDFVFEQSLMDTYSDLISEVNPDDFLDLEGGVDREVGGAEESGGSLAFGSYPMEELEEGEIADF
ncbi:uncharacterized protein LOC131165085 isoform X1 [Malania oleifera]|uniref:uncharacterized protein LOC131165085 isoform X1 n=1 Tax=Malania oleifera TaxID=397392 RepID=UPI0025AEAA7D|nr:uncharacterized protein LOC131165085 isoform X1 [Malania oleifera]